MSLTLIKEPARQYGNTIQDLRLGTWFIDFQKQIYLVALDDQTHERRIVCLGNYYHPFIVNLPTTAIDIDRVLEAGSLLQITDAIGGQDND